MTIQAPRRRGKPRSIRVGGGREGIVVEFVRRRKAIHIFGWYETFCGMENLDLPLEEFCRQLGIRRRDLPE